MIPGHRSRFLDVHNFLAHTQENHVYVEATHKGEKLYHMTKAQVADMVQLWWDGISDGWTTDKQSDELIRERRVGCKHFNITGPDGIEVLPL